MLRRTTIVVCVLSLVVSAGAIASATSYTFVTLNYLGGDTGGSGLGVSRVGGVPEVARARITRSRT